MAEEKKRCCACKQRKSLESFVKNRATLDGLSRACKECARIRNRKYNLQHKEERKQYNRRYYQEHKEEISRRIHCYQQEHKEELLRKGALWTQANQERVKATQLKSRLKHKDDIQERSRKYRIEHPDRVRGAQRRWERNHPGKVKAKLRRRIAARRSVDENFTDEMDCFVREFWNHKCAVCGESRRVFENRFPMDHWLPLTPENGGRGYPLAPGNAVLMCHKHNSQKKNRLPYDVFGEDVARRIELRLRKQIELWNKTKKIVGVAS